ncbi:MAG: 4a-hydroxytetrahydrobiopterin dehydratase [Micavibrio sp.]
MKKLTQTEIDKNLAELDGWEIHADRPAITRKFKFKDFVEAWNFMDDVAGYADEISHHPEWTNVYNRVEIILTTHEAGGLTAIDFDLAAFIDEVASEA